MTNACLKVPRQSGKICLVPENRKASFSFQETSLWMDLLIFPEKKKRVTAGKSLWQTFVGEKKENKRRDRGGFLWLLKGGRVEPDSNIPQSSMLESLGLALWSVFSYRHSALHMAALLHSTSRAFAAEMSFLCWIQVPKPWSSLLITPWPELATAFCGGSAGLDPRAALLSEFLHLFLFLCLESWSGEIWDPSCRIWDFWTPNCVWLDQI